MIDYGYEDRLVDRIAAREAIASRLTPRQRHVLSRCYHYGETYREVAVHDAVSATRISQIHDRAVRLLRIGFANPPKIAPTRPQQATRDTPPPGFDKAEFLRHMRLLIELREQHAIWERQEEARREREAAEQARREELARKARELGREQREFERERAELARLIAGETAKNAPPPPPFVPDSAKAPPGSHFNHLPHLGDTLKIKLPVQYTVGSPSYHPPPPPTLGDLNRIAHAALMYLFSAHPQFDGTQTLGKWCTSVVFTRDGGEVSEAVNSIVRELPAHARLSAYPVPIEDGTLGAHATTPYASLRVTVTPDGLNLRFDVTWD